MRFQLQSAAKISLCMALDAQQAPCYTAHYALLNNELSYTLVAHKTSAQTALSDACRFLPHPHACLPVHHCLCGLHLLHQLAPLIHHTLRILDDGRSGQPAPARCVVCTRSIHQQLAVRQELSPAAVVTALDLQTHRPVTGQHARVIHMCGNEPGLLQSYQRMCQWFLQIDTTLRSSSTQHACNACGWQACDNASGRPSTTCTQAPHHTRELSVHHLPTDLWQLTSAQKPCRCSSDSLDFVLLTATCYTWKRQTALKGVHCWHNMPT